MIERFLLYGVHTKSTRPPVGGQHDLVVHSLTNEAQPLLTLTQPAIPWAQIALDALVV